MNLNPADFQIAHEWGRILPEIMLGLLALALLGLEVLVPAVKRWLPQLTIAVQLLLGLLVGWQALGAAPEGPRLLFGGMLEQNAQTPLYRCFFLFSGAFVAHLGLVFLRNQPLARVEFYHVLLIVNASMMLLVQSAHFGMLFIALETLTIGFYILVAYGRNSSFSLEAGLKFLVMGALSSAILLFGIALLFGAASNPAIGGGSEPMQFNAFADAMQAYGEGGLPVYALLGAGMVIAGIAFKIGLVPFQIWIPDVYQGAPTPVTAFLAVSSKSAGILLLLHLVNGPFRDLEAVVVPLLVLFTAATVVFGNFTALPQRNVKRLMGLSGVSHAGILVLGILASRSEPWLVPVIFFYLVVYALASFAVFEVMAHVGPVSEDADQEFEDYSELMQRQPLLGAALAIGLGSLAGVPPLAGFVAKALILYGALQAGLYALVALTILGVILSFYYYFSWMRSSVTPTLFPEEHRGEPRRPGAGARILLYTLTALTVVFGLYQGFFSFTPWG